MTFEEFVATRREVANLDAELGFGHEGPGFVYEGECHIECLMDGEVPNGYLLVIGNQDWSGPNLGELERVLFDKWAQGELS